MGPALPGGSAVQAPAGSEKDCRDAEASHVDASAAVACALGA